MIFDQILDFYFRDIAESCNPFDLIIGCCLADMRVEPTGGTGDQIDRNRISVVWIGCFQFRNAFFYVVREFRIGRTQIGTAGRLGIVWMCCRSGRSSPEIFRFGKVLSDQT